MESISSPSLPLSSSSISNSIINNENFNQLVKTKENFLISKYKNIQDINEQTDITQLLSNILKDFYDVQENYLTNNNNIDNQDPKEIINEILTDIFFNEPFDKYICYFSIICKQSSRRFLTESILDRERYSSLFDFLEKETFKTKIPFH